MRNLHLILFLILSSGGYSQEPALSYCNRLSVDSLKEKVFILASDSLEGRETGQTGQKKAAQYISERYRSMGLIPAGTYYESGISLIPGKKNPEKEYLQNHPINLKSNKGRNLSVNGQNFLFGRDFFYPHYYKDTALFIDKLIFAGTGIKSNINDVIKTVNSYDESPMLMFDIRQDTGDYLMRALVSGLLKPRSAVFIICTDKKIEKYFSSGLSLQVNPQMPFIFISENVADKIISSKQLRKIRDKLKRSSKTIIRKIESEISVGIVGRTDEITGQNVLAYIPGTDRNTETVVVSAHYDHLGVKDSLVYYGADDNASGTAALLEIARLFSIAKSEGYPPRRNILFLHVSGEEKGLLGSTWYVNHPFFPMKSTIANLNIDMIGRTDPHNDSLGITNYLYLIGSDKMSSELKKISEEQNQIGPQLILDYTFDSPDDPNQYYKRSDHYNFAKKGVPVIFYFDGVHDDYHLPSDTPDKINYDLLAERTRLVFLTAWELVNSNQKIKIDRNGDQ